MINGNDEMRINVTTLCRFLRPLTEFLMMTHCLNYDSCLSVRVIAIEVEFHFNAIVN